MLDREEEEELSMYVTRMQLSPVHIFMSVEKTKREIHFTMRGAVLFIFKTVLGKDKRARSPNQPQLYVSLPHRLGFHNS